MDRTGIYDGAVLPFMVLNKLLHQSGSQALNGYATKSGLSDSNVLP